MAIEVSLNLLSAVKSVQSENQAMRNYAYRSAASNITGSGVRIFTNSFTSFMVHSAVEKSVLKSQAKKADQEYEEAIKRISTSSMDRFEKANADAIFNQFLPKLPDIFTKFHDELLSNYLLELSKHNQFNSDVLENYSEKKSSTMLDNIKYAEDKHSLLQQAFAECPFNLDIYEKMLQLGYFDFDTFIDAKKIFRKSEMDNLLEEKIKSNLNDIENIKSYAKVLSRYKNKDELSILSPFYKKIITKIRCNYQDIRLMCENHQNIKKWIKKNISADLNYVMKMSDTVINDYVKKYFNNLIDEKQLKEFIAIGLVSIDDIKYTNSEKTTLEEIQKEYIKEVVLVIENFLKELGEKKAAYEKAYEKYYEGLIKYMDAIDAKNDELKQQGLFAFSKKKEIKEELDRLNNEYEEYRRTEPVNLKNAYFNI